MTTETVVQTFLQRLAAQDADGLAELFADTIDWYVPGHAALPWTGARSSKEEVPHYFRTMWPRFVVGRSSAEIDKIVISGPDAVLFATFGHTIAENGASFRTPVAMRFEVVDDKIIRMHLFEDTGRISEAFFGSAGAPDAGHDR